MAEFPQVLVAVPGLADVVADPTLLDRLPTEVIIGLRRQLRRLDADLEATIARQIVRGQKYVEMGSVLGVEAAAKRLDTSVDSLYRKHRRLRLGYIDPLDGRLKFTEREIADYIRRQQRT